MFMMGTIWDTRQSTELGALIPALPLTGHGMLGKSLPLSEPWFFYLQSDRAGLEDL